MKGIFISFLAHYYRRAARCQRNIRDQKTARAIVKKTTVQVSIIVAVVFCFLILSPPATVFAQTATNTITEGIQVVEQPLGLPSADVRVLIARIIRVALGLLGTVFLVLILYGGYLWMTAGGNAEQIDSSKKILINATIGLIIVLSAYAIVLLVMRLLGIGVGGDGGGGGGAGGDQNYVGSGGLGLVVKDHYPARNQTDIPRNSKIIITFFKPIKMDTIARDINTPAGGVPVFGDCVNIGPQMNWESDCDQLKLDAITITRADTNEPIKSASVLGSYENGQVYTVVIRPNEYLGSADQKVPYKVRVTNLIRFDNPASGHPAIFAGRADTSNFYEWDFTCDTILDTLPPRVASVYPEAGTESPKNTVIQIFFNDAMDPTGIQGTFSAANSHYVLSGNNIFLKSEKSTLPLGTMRLTNGYKTLEFTPSIQCGVNACGGKIYCLPVCDKPGVNCQTDPYDILLKAARTFSGTSFESIPFSGVMDVAGNALDSSDPYADKPKSATTTLPVFNKWKEPDNYFWNFNVKNELDLTAPYLRATEPGVNDSYVGANAEWSMTFSKRMRVEPMYYIGLEEKPPSVDKNGAVIPLCRTPRVDNSTGFGYTRLDHCPFLDTSRHYYYPIVDSQIEDVNFNCFYPGKGPVLVDTVCDEAHPQNCCQVTSTPQSRAFCCNGAVTIADKATCLGSLKADSP